MVHVVSQYLPHFHAVSQAFSAQLYGIEQLYHDQAYNREAETERGNVKTCTLENSSCNNNCRVKNIVSTLAIGYAIGKQIQTSTRTNGATAAPIASP